MHAVLAGFHPIIQRWFASRFAAPSPAQELGWPAIAGSQHTLIAAPTGSGKTLAAFLIGLDALVRQSLASPDRLPDATQLLYVSPLKALANDVQRNLLEPLAQITALAQEMGTPIGEVRVSVRTGDTSTSERTSHARRPPHIMITTPESLYLLLTSERGRRMLKSVRTLILDELHAVAPNKRGAHLALSVERLCHLVEQPITRIGLSATQHPIQEVAHFLTGAPDAPATDAASVAGASSAPDDNTGYDAVAAQASGTIAAQAITAPLPEGARDGRATSSGQGTQRGFAPLPGGEGGVPPSSALSPLPGKEGGQGDGRAAQPPCTIVNTGHRRAMDIGIELPQGFELGPIATHEEWAQVLDQVAALVRAHKTTLVFVNTRRLVERVAHLMSDRLGEDQVVAHHGSLSREKRFAAEQQLKAGTVQLCVATASLELGIDIGDVDLVCQVGSPRNIGVALQRVGRSGHQVRGLPKGRFFPLTRDELVETVALLRAIAAGTLDALHIPEWPLDILAQQVVAACVNEEWEEDALFATVRRAYPYHALPRERFDQVVAMLSEGVATRWGRGTAHLHRDGVHHRLKARRGARIVAITGGGAIPDNADYLVIAEPDGALVGSVNEDFAIESMAGDVFLLGNTPWRIRRVEAGTVRVESAQGQAPTIPFWLGEAPGRTVELSAGVSAVRQAVDDLLPDEAAAIAWLMEAGASHEAAEQVVAYIAEGKRVLGMVPTVGRVVAERFFDEAGGMQLVVHAPFGSRINRAWGLALRKRFCAGFDFELQASATDEGINISLGPQHSFPVEEVFRYLKTETAQDVLTQAVLQSPLFPTRWRWDATRSLALLRFSGGKRVPTAIQRMRADDLMAAVFPALAACQDNRDPGPIPVPDHPLVFETLRDCLTEALDTNGFLDVLRRIERGDIAVYGRDTVQPSAFSHQILNAMPYAFLDDAPLEERRARAVTLRRALPNASRAQDLGILDAETITREVANAWPPVRDADELHDALLSLGVLPADVVSPRGGDTAAWAAWHAALVAGGRALTIHAGGRALWLATERAALVAAAYPDAASQARAVAGTPTPFPLHGERSDASGSHPAASADDIASFDEQGAQGGAVLLPGGKKGVPPSALSFPLPVQEGGQGDSRILAPEAAATEIVRGWAEVAGPFTLAEFAATLALPESRVQQAVLRLETEGLVLRGQFRPGAVADGSMEFCDRRLLARIHRATISRLRQEVEPVPPASYVRFLLEWQHVAPGTQVASEAGLLEVIEQLQGYEAAAAVWEQALFPARVKDYAPSMLDSLCFGGEVVWGRFARRVPATTVTAGLSRNGPVSLALRDEVPWLLDPAPAEGLDTVPLSGAAQEVLAHLQAHGASFLSDVVSGTRRLPSDVEDALWQLVAAGLVTADGFGALRGLVTGLARRVQRTSRFRRRARGRVPSSRWALLHANAPPTDEDIAEARAAQLLRRYGVVTRELLAREPMAASVGGWRPLLHALRRAEARGEVRGGRFIAGLVGEQFALPEAVEALRAVHRKTPSGAIVRLSACDPLNLVGIVVPGTRVPATPGNSVGYRDGVPLDGEAGTQVA